MHRRGKRSKEGLKRESKLPSKKAAGSPVSAIEPHADQIKSKSTNNMNKKEERCLDICKKAGHSAFSTVFPPLFPPPLSSSNKASLLPLFPCLLMRNESLNSMPNAIHRSWGACRKIKRRGRDIPENGKNENREKMGIGVEGGVCLNTFLLVTPFFSLVLIELSGIVTALVIFRLLSQPGQVSGV